jgi:protein TonB
MFGILVESSPRPRRRRGAIVASMAAHAAVILVGIWASADGGEPPAAVPPEVLAPPWFHSPPPRAPAPPESPRSAPSSSAVDDPAPLPNVPALRADLGIDVPTGLPPVETALGDPFAGPVVPTATIGVRRDGRTGSQVPGSVIDGRYADKPALPLESNPRPPYPEALRTAGIEGTVDVEFVIDANGRLRPGSLVLLRSDHPRFAESVRDALPGYRFLPAEVGGRPVAVLVRQRFAFTLD